MEKFAISQAHQFYEQRSFQKAYEAFQELVKDYPEDSRMYAMLAYLEMQVGDDLDATEALINKAQTLGCPEDYYHRIRGELMWVKGQHDKALAEYELSVAAEPSSSNLSALATALSDIGDKRAASIWEKVIEKDPENYQTYLHCARDAIKRKEFYKALGMAKLAEYLEPSNPEVLFGIGYVYQSLKLYRKALEYFLKAQDEGYKDQGYLCALIAMCYGATDDGANAISFANKAAKLSPKNNYVQEVLKYCKERIFQFLGENRKSDAYIMMSTAIDIWPDDSKLLASMAGLEMEIKKNYELGKSYMKKAFQCNNASPDLLYEIKGALWYDYLNEKQEGLACLEKAVSLNRNKFNLTALAYRLININCKRAEELYKEILRLDPKDICAICCLAEIALKKKNWAKGFELAVKADSLKSDDPQISVMLGDAQFNMGKFTEALNCYVKADTLNHPEKSRIYCQIVKCYQKLGKFQKAKVYIKKALSANPDYPETREFLTQLDAENL